MISTFLVLLNYQKTIQFDLWNTTIGDFVNNIMIIVAIFLIGVVVVVIDKIKKKNKK